MNHDTRLESVAAITVLVGVLTLTAGAQTTIDYTVTAEPGWWALHAGRVTTTWMYGGEGSGGSDRRAASERPARLAAAQHDAHE